MSQRPTPADAHRATTLPGWRWMPGMLDGASGLRVADVLPEIGGVYLLRVSLLTGSSRLTLRTRDDMRQLEMRPDLADPATAGCLMYLLVGATGGIHAPPEVWGWTPGERAVRCALNAGRWGRLNAEPMTTEKP